MTAATIGGTIRAAAARLVAAGVPEARREARLLAAHALAVQPEAIVGHPERPVPAAAVARVAALAARRAAREPFARIVGTREFWSLPFHLSPATLVPRPDSETVVAAALPWLRAAGPVPRALDLGTGSGCLLLALLAEVKAAQGIGVDLSFEAATAARANARALGLADRSVFVCGDWGTALGAPFDVVVCNPPYVADGDIDGLDPEVARFEPRLALAGGADGLASYRAVAADLGRLLAPAGVGIFEVGAGQAAAVAAILAGCGFAVREIRNDLGGVPRCVVAGREQGR